MNRIQKETARTLYEHRNNKMLKERVYCSLLVDFAVMFSYKDDDFDQWEFWRAAGYKYKKPPAHRFNVLTRAKNDMYDMNHPDVEYGY
jgi:hypothetical protein